MIRQQVSLAVFIKSHGADLDAAAGLSGPAERGRGVKNHHTAVAAGAQRYPDMSVDTHDIAGMKP